MTRTFFLREERVCRWGVCLVIRLWGNDFKNMAGKSGVTKTQDVCQRHICLLKIWKTKIVFFPDLIPPSANGIMTSSVRREDSREDLGGFSPTRTIPGSSPSCRTTSVANFSQQQQLSPASNSQRQNRQVVRYSKRPSNDATLFTLTLWAGINQSKGYGYDILYIWVLVELMYSLKHVRSLWNT